MTSPATSLTGQLGARWAALDGRQQRLVQVGGALLAVVLLVVFVWLPLERTHRQLAARLPALQAQHAAMQRDADEVKRLRSLPATLAPSGGTTRAPDANALRTLFPGADVTALGSGRYRVQLADGRFGAWLDGVRALNGQLVVAELNATRDPANAAKLRIEAVLQPAKAGA